MGANDREPRLGFAQPLHQLGDPRCLQQGRIRRGDRRLRLVDPVDDGLVLPPKMPSSATCIRAVMMPSALGLGPEVGSGHFG